jgi:Subtilase family
LIDGEFAPLASVCAFIDRYAARIAAASGNDGIKIPDETTHVPKDFHPSARYPAAYDSVLGVAALDVDKKMATYSNEPDVPKTAGAAAFGGIQTDGVTDPNLGVIGAYIGAYPDGVPNTQGLASWSGTSFATPVVSAALATLLCEDPEHALDRIKAHFTNQATEGDGNASAPAGPGSSSTTAA